MLNKSCRNQIISYENYEEAIIKSPPFGNIYNIIEPFQQSTFPYCMIGKLKIYFKINSSLWKRCECIGTVIGPDVVLTTAHSLTYEHSDEDKSKKVLRPEKIIFLPNINGDFKPFKTVEHLSFIVSERYYKVLKNQEKELRNSDFDDELLDDYGLVILNRNIGDEIIKLYQLDNQKELNLIPFKFGDNEELLLYEFFVKADENFNKVEKNIFLPNISLISYTKYKEDYLQSIYYPYSSNFKVIKKKIIKKEEEYSKKFQSSSSENSLSNNTNENKENNNVEVNTDKVTIHPKNSSLFTSSQNFKTKSDLNTNNLSHLNSTQADNRNSSDKLTNYFYRPKMSIKNNNHRSKEIDSIIFDEEFSKKFFCEGNPVLCEAKGVIDNNSSYKDFSDINLVIRYRITTFSGQSGSPIFLRLKEKRLEGERSYQSNEPKEEKYYFVGIHCQRPKNLQIRQKPFEEQNNISQKEINDNTLGNKKPLERKTMNCSLLDSGFSDYNIGLKIDSLIIKTVVQSVLKEKSNLSFFFKKNSVKINYLSSLKKHFNPFFEENYIYLPIRLYVADKIILQGVIHQERNLEQIYIVGERLFKDIPIRFISLIYKEQNMDHEFFSNLKVKDMKKYMKSYLKKVKNESETDYDLVYEFEISINFKEYGSYLANNIFQKLEESSFQLIKNKDEVNSSCLVNKKKHPHLNINNNKKELCISKLKVLHNSIIENINFLSQYSFIFGTLYNNVKDRLLEKYHIY